MTEFDLIGTLREWIQKSYSNYTIKLLEEDYYESNIPVYITTSEEISIRILCTKRLSEVIRRKEIKTDDLHKRIVIKVLKDDGTSFLRLSDLIVSRVV